MRYRIMTLFVLATMLTIAYRTGVSTEVGAGFQPLTEAHLRLEVGQQHQDVQQACPMTKNLPMNVCESSGTTCAEYSESDCPNQSWRAACLVEVTLTPAAEGIPRFLTLDLCDTYDTGRCKWEDGACVCGAPASFGMCGFKSKESEC